MTALMESRSGALELPSSAVASLAALVMRCIRAPALPRLARSPPNIRCRTPSTADIAAAHRYAWPADWPSPFCLARGGASLCVPTGLVCMRPLLGVGKVVFAPPHAYPRLHSLLLDSLEPVDTESRSYLARNTERRYCVNGVGYSTHLHVWTRARRSARCPPRASSVWGTVIRT